LELSPDATWAVLVSHRAGRPRYVGYHCGPGLHFGNPAWGVEAFLPSARIGGFLAPGDRFVGIRGRRLVVYDTPTGKMHDVFPYPARYARCCAASADGSRFAAMGYDKLYLWDTTVWGAPRRVTGLNRWIHSMAFHPTRPLLLTSQNLLSLVKYLDADTGKPVRKFDWKLGEMGPVAFSPDGTLAAAGSRGGKIVVWDVEI
jgi:WD40 repeat protein